MTKIRITHPTCTFVKTQERRKVQKLIIALSMMLMSVLCSHADMAPHTATTVQQTDALCAKCHQSIFRSYLNTPMANASGPAFSRMVPGTFLHPPSQIEYRLSAEGDEARLSYRRVPEPALSGSKHLDYFLGSGHLGLTYLYVTNGYLLESPVAYYPSLKAYDMKPGLERIDHMPGALTVNATCLRCHMSAVQRPDPGTENHYQGLPFLHTGITCESCHGNTQAHVMSNGSAKVVNPAKLDAAKRDSTCIVCHLEGTTNVERPGRSVLDFEPGQDISDYISYFAYVRESSMQRGVSEIEQFTSSKCKRISGPVMSCLNCHDPHHSPAPRKRAVFYRNKCLACHSQPQFAVTHYPSHPDCTNCHMPKTGAANIPHVAWTDHRILQHPDHDATVSHDATSGRELAPIFPGSSSRDLALAYYNLAVGGDRTVAPRATALLSIVVKSSQTDVAVLRAFGVLAEWNGNAAEAEALYRGFSSRIRRP